MIDTVHYCEKISLLDIKIYCSNEITQDNKEQPGPFEGQYCNTVWWSESHKYYTFDPKMTNCYLCRERLKNEYSSINSVCCTFFKRK